MHPTLASLISAGPIRRRDHRAHASHIDEALAAHEIVAPFRGVYTLPDPDHDVRVRALLLADPTAVLTDASAAHAHGWRPEADAVHAATRLLPRPGYVFRRRRIPRTLIARAGGTRRTSRALTALDLARVEGASAIDDALRRRLTLDSMRAALDLTPQVAGNALLRTLLNESRSTPWSPAERTGHRALRDDGVRGWVANHTIALDADARAVVDIAFKALRLAIEIDGVEHHSSRAAFVRDRRRDVALARRGWQVVRFPASWVLASPGSFAEAVAAIVAARASGLA